MKVLVLCVLLAAICPEGVWGTRYHTLSKQEREGVCQSKEAKCIWLNDHLFRPRGLPLHSSLCCQCQPEVICYDMPVTLYTWMYMWDRLTVTIRTARPKTLVLTTGNSSHTALSAVYSHNTSTPLPLSPYGTHCVALKRARCSGGSEDVTEYSIDARLEMLALYPILTALCLALFFLAPSLSRNVPLIYGTGVTIGILASLLILLYILSRYMPGKNFLGLGLLAGGYTVIGTLMYWFFNNMLDVIQEYWQYLLGYVVTAGLLTFGAMYYWGGVTNPRAHNLIQWTLQLVACLGLYMASRLTETSLTMLALVLMTYVTPMRYNPLFCPFLLIGLHARVCSCLRRVRPHYLAPMPPRRLLTNEEYEEQGRVETEKAMKQLKKYLSANPQVVNKLQDTSRGRVRKFVSGESGHVPEDEEINHDLTFLDDSDSEDEASPSPDRSPSSTGRSYSYASHSASYLQPSVGQRPSSVPRSHSSASTRNPTHHRPHSAQRYGTYYTTPPGVMSH